MKVEERREVYQHKSTFDNNKKELKNRLDKEIEQLAKEYDQKIENVKAQSIEKLDQGRKIADTEILEAIKVKESKLSNIKKTLTSDQDRLEKEKQIIIDSYKNKIEETNKYQNYKAEEAYTDALNKNIEIQDKTKEINSKQDIIVAKEKGASNRKIQKVQQAESFKVSEQKKSYEDMLSKDKKEFEKIVTSEKSGQQKEVSRLRIHNNFTLQELARGHKTELDQLKVSQNKKLIVQKNNFETRFQNISSQHLEIIGESKKQLEKELDKLVENYAIKTVQINNKSKDNFYQLGKISPQVLDQKDHYLVSIKTPEYEKEGFSISVNERQIKLTKTRRYGDEITNDQGVRNRVNRSETFTKVVSTQDIMNRNGILSEYKDGTLIFKIKKA